MCTGLSNQIASRVSVALRDSMYGAGGGLGDVIKESIARVEEYSDENTEDENMKNYRSNKVLLFTCPFIFCICTHVFMN